MAASREFEKALLKEIRSVKKELELIRKIKSQLAKSKFSETEAIALGRKVKHAVSKKFRRAEGIDSGG